MQVDWSKIKSGNFSNGKWYDFGNLRLKLAEQRECWNLSLAVRVYTLDGKWSMMRPFASVARFGKPCTEEEAKERMCEYLDELVKGVLDCAL